eukprot:14689356-Alexandrium_andersonii.AAC.1
MAPGCRWQVCACCSTERQTRRRTKGHWSRAAADKGTQTSCRVRRQTYEEAAARCGRQWGYGAADKGTPTSCRAATAENTRTSCRAVRQTFGA